MRVAMIGTGYVDLVSGACMADLGHNIMLLTRMQPGSRHWNGVKSRCTSLACQIFSCDQM